MDRGLRPQGLHEALLYERLGGGNVRCRLCERRCLIREGGRGFCGTRVNLDGVLYTLTYGALSAIESRPIEIKPFHHFWPGSTALTFSTWGCNFLCPWCQNWHISRRAPDRAASIFTPPEAVVSQALGRDEGVCVSFNEPLMLFEYSLDVFKMARAKGLYTTYVSNGYMTIEALEALVNAGLDGLKIDVKGGEAEYLKFNNASSSVVWRNAQAALRMGVHVEIVYLVVTGATDDEQLILDVIERHLRLLGPEVPLHFTRYFPAYRYREKPTSIEKLEWAYNQARKMGVLFPYVGNVPGHPFENTYCPQCGKLLMRRLGARLVSVRLAEGYRCPSCGAKIPIRGEVRLKRHPWRSA